MIRSRAIDRILPIALLLVMIGAGILLARQEVWLRLRQNEITTLALVRTQQMLRVRLDVMFHEWNEDLLEEAAAIPRVDTFAISSVQDRWDALLNSHWAIRSIRLADERGNESALFRTDSTFFLVLTHEGSKDSLPQAFRLSADGTMDTVVAPVVLGCEL